MRRGSKRESCSQQSCCLLPGLAGGQDKLAGPLDVESLLEALPQEVVVHAQVQPAGGRRCEWPGDALLHSIAAPLRCTLWKPGSPAATCVPLPLQALRSYEHLDFTWWAHRDGCGAGGRAVFGGGAGGRTAEVLANVFTAPQALCIALPSEVKLKRNVAEKRPHVLQGSGCQGRHLPHRPGPAAGARAQGTCALSGAHCQLHRRKASWVVYHHCIVEGTACVVQPLYHWAPLFSLGSLAEPR